MKINPEGYLNSFVLLKTYLVSVCSLIGKLKIVFTFTYNVINQKCQINKLVLSHKINKIRQQFIGYTSSAKNCKGSCIKDKCNTVEPIVNH